MNLLRLLYCSICTVLSPVIYILRYKDQHNHKRTQRICKDVNNVLVFQLLGELLLDRHNFTVMTRYISNQENLKLMMNMLRDKSRNIQFEAFHVFKVITLVTITSINYAFHAPFPEFYFQNTCETSLVRKYPLLIILHPFIFVLYFSCAGLLLFHLIFLWFRDLHVFLQTAVQ